MWNDLPYTVFDTGMPDGFKGAVVLVECQVLVGLQKQFINFVLPTWPELLVLIIIIIIIIITLILF